MPSIDMSRAELETYAPETYAPSDLDDYWAETLRAALEQPLGTRVEPYVLELAGVRCSQLHFDGFAGGSIAAWYLHPTGDGPFPAVAGFHGYGGRAPRPLELYPLAAQGVAVLAMDCRAQDGGSSDQVARDGGHLTGWMTDGVRDPLQYYYRYVYADVVRALEVLCAQRIEAGAARHHRHVVDEAVGGNTGDARKNARRLGGLDQAVIRDTREAAGRRRLSLLQERGQTQEQGAHRLEIGIGILRVVARPGIEPEHVLGSGEMIEMDIRRERKIMPGAVGGIESGAAVPVFDRTQFLENLGARAGFFARFENAGAHAAQGVAGFLPGEGKILGRGEMLLMLHRGRARLRETLIEGEPHGGDMDNHAIEDAPASGGGVEAEIEEAAQKPPALRRAMGDGDADAPGERVDDAVCVRRLVAEKGDEIAGRGKAEPEHKRVARGIGEFIDVIGVEAAAAAELGRARRAGEGFFRAIGERPILARDEARRIGLMHPLGEGGAGGAEIGGGIGDAVAEIGRAEVERGAGGEKLEILAHRAGDRAAIGKAGERGGEGERAVRRQIALPAAPDQRKTLAFEEAIADLGRAAATIIEPRRQLPAAIDHVIKQDMVAAIGGDRHQDHERRRVGDFAIRAARGEGEILDAGILALAGIDLTMRNTGDALVLSAGAKRHAAERGRFHRLQIQAENARLSRARGEAGKQKRGE